MLRQLDKTTFYQPCGKLLTTCPKLLGHRAVTTCEYQLVTSLLVACCGPVKISVEQGMRTHPSCGLWQQLVASWLRACCNLQDSWCVCRLPLIVYQIWHDMLVKATIKPSLTRVTALLAYSLVGGISCTILCFLAGKFHHIFIMPLVCSRHISFDQWKYLASCISMTNCLPL